VIEDLADERAGTGPVRLELRPSFQQVEPELLLHIGPIGVNQPGLAHHLPGLRADQPLEVVGDFEGVLLYIHRCQSSIEGVFGR
jgi:hypothetical protein